MGLLTNPFVAHSEPIEINLTGGAHCEGRHVILPFDVRDEKNDLKKSAI